MYSKVPFPPGVNNVYIKQPQRTTPNAVRGGALVADKCGDTWFVYHEMTGRVAAIYYMKPNVHGWSASEAHAKSHVLKSEPFNPFELDTIP